MTDVIKLSLTSGISNITKLTNQILFSEIIISESPELFLISIRIVGSMVSGVTVASVVTEPNIVTSVSQNEGRSLIFRVNEESVRVVEETVLHEDNR